MDPSKGKEMIEVCINCGKQLKYHHFIMPESLPYCDNKDCIRYGFLTEIKNFVYKGEQ
jgi:hypothetical protein